METNNPQILTIGIKDRVALIDYEDKDLVGSHNWNLHWYGYARTVINGKTVSMHRLVMNCFDNNHVHHINGNPLDNRKQNLQILSPNDHSKKNKRLCFKNIKDSLLIGIIADDELMLGISTEKPIGEQIKEKRTSAGLSHEQLAVAIGVTGQTIRNWEAGIYEPKVSDWEAINRETSYQRKEVKP